MKEPRRLLKWSWVGKWVLPQTLVAATTIPSWNGRLEQGRFFRKLMVNSESHPVRQLSEAAHT